MHDTPPTRRRRLAPSSRPAAPSRLILPDPTSDVRRRIGSSSASLDTSGEAEGADEVGEPGRLIAEVAEDEALLSDLAADLGARRLSRAEWIAARGPIEGRLQANRATLRSLGHGDKIPADLAQLDAERWASLDFDQRRWLLRLFLERVVVDPIGKKAGSKFRPERIRIYWRA